MPTITLQQKLEAKQLIFGGLLGTTQLGLDFGEDSAFCGVECKVKNATECGVDHIVEYKSAKWTA